MFLKIEKCRNFRKMNKYIIIFVKIGYNTINNTQNIVYNNYIILFLFYIIKK